MSWPLTITVLSRLSSMVGSSWLSILQPRSTYFDLQLETTQDPDRLVSTFYPILYVCQGRTILIFNSDWPVSTFGPNQLVSTFSLGQIVLIFGSTRLDFWPFLTFGLSQPISTLDPRVVVSNCHPKQSVSTFGLGRCPNRTQSTRPRPRPLSMQPQWTQPPHTLCRLPLLHTSR